MAEVDIEKVKELREKAVELVRSSRSYVVVGIRDGGGIEWCGDTTECVDEGDLRQYFMRQYFQDTVGSVERLDRYVEMLRKEAEEKAKAERFKEERTKELSGEESK